MYNTKLQSKRVGYHVERRTEDISVTLNTQPAKYTHLSFRVQWYMDVVR